MSLTKCTQENISRRDLLTKGGKLAVVGAAFISGGGLALAGCGTDSNGGNTMEGNSMTSATNSAQLPWKYVKLSPQDIKKAAELAHENWFQGFCCYAVLSGIVTVLREKVGEPYTSFPVEAFIFAHGGTAGWGGTCGTLIGAGIAASLATGAKTGEAITNQVMKYYSETELPIYKPDAPKAELKTVSRSDTPVCHLSVGKWMKKEGVGFLSAQQMERCGRLSADVATKTIEFLNANVDGKFDPGEKAPVFVKGMPTQNNCTECHGANVPVVPQPGGGEGLLKTGH